MARAASACGHVRARLSERAPALLDVTPLPDQHRDSPRKEEHPDYRVAERAEVEPPEPAPDLALERQPVGQDLKDLDAADHERDRHRKGRDRDVVVDASDR